ncbi:MAG: bifunctional 2',3'-cyclic-nucleotide 2'-phosphodiesterase/3'-nucleotidase [Treponema sp.]|jgi:2',3'-cyclic-nucleotide 2'-phosphodiesterase/3'-nucleotidase|nr:bifunctional 2',3'-cyclic-nucleotide 2'-phosphodiesterase/3'-nucleotidase [Treponema sp.]
MRSQCQKAKFPVRFAFTLLLLLSALAALSGQTMDITILATSDVHNNYMDYDYFTDTPTEQTGLVRIATAIKEIRARDPNVLLFDNGDLIQGNPVGEYLAALPLEEGEPSPIMELFNIMKYDAMVLGNHEFNFGLPYLDAVIRGANFPVLGANVVTYFTGAPYYRPYNILVRNFTDRDGNLQSLKIGVLGVLTPQIVTWDGALLKGKVRTLDGYDAARRYVPEIKAAGADIVVILAHTGIQDYPRKGGEENFGHFLTEIPGVDVVITGHAHEKFPGRAFERMRGVDTAKGTINGIPVVMPGSFADTLGLVRLALRRTSEGWERIDGSGSLLPVYDSAARKANYAADPELRSLLNPLHEAVLEYIRAPVGASGGGDAAGGRLTAALTSFFAVIRDDYSVQIINEAQIHYARQVLASGPYAKLPILSAAAPFKAGGRQGPRYYTNVPAGPLAIKNIADLYVYPNTVVILKLSGAGIKEWLEHSAGQFNQLDGGNQGEQYIQNDDFPTYLYDVIDGSGNGDPGGEGALTYKIDTTQPAKYNRDGSIQNPGAERIKELRYNGAPIDPAQEFALVTNNYRAYGGGNFPGGSPGNIILESPDESRQVILRYINEKRELSPRPNNNWELILPQGSGPLLFLSSPEANTPDSLPAGISFVRATDTGFAVYQVQP